jgi:hypothetical protein
VGVPVDLIGDRAGAVWARLRWPKRWFPFFPSPSGLSAGWRARPDRRHDYTARGDVLSGKPTDRARAKVGTRRRCCPQPPGTDEPVAVASHPVIVAVRSRS